MLERRQDRGRGNARDYARLAAPLVNTGVLKLSDWPATGSSPIELVKRGWERISSRFLRRAGDALYVDLALSPAAAVLDDWEPDDIVLESCAAVCVDVNYCVVISLREIVDCWGETAAAVVLAAFQRGLGPVTNVFTPDALEWVAEWWVDCADTYADENADDEEDGVSSRVRALDNLRAFRECEEYVGRLERHFGSAAEARHALDAIPVGPVRDCAAALLGSAVRGRRLGCWDALSHLLNAERGNDTAAVLITRDTRTTSSVTRTTSRRSTP